MPEVRTLPPLEPSKDEQGIDTPLLTKEGEGEVTPYAFDTPLLTKEGQGEVTPYALDTPLLTKEGQGEVTPYALVFLSVALFLEAAAAALLQPLVANPISPIRAPIVPPELESNVLYAAIAFAVAILAVFILAIALLRGPGRPALRTPLVTEYAERARPYGTLALFAIALVLAPLYFLTFTLTKESTAFVEIALKSLGL